MKRLAEYQAEDGERFATAEECKRHERGIKIARIAEMSMQDVNDAVSRKDQELADAIEFVGNLIAEKRRADGDVKRKKKTDAEKLADVAAAMQKT